MSAQSVFTLGIVVTSAGQINQIESMSKSPGIQTVAYSGSGQAEQRFAAAMFMQPVLGFTTSAIARALTVVGQDGLAIAGSATDLYFQKMAQGGTRTNTASVKWSTSYGLLCPRTLQAADREHATISYELWARSNDGTTSPLAVSTGQTMPSVTADDQMYTVGPASINSTAIADVQSISIDFGLAMVAVSGGGEMYPTLITIARRSPSIRIRTLDQTLANTMGLMAAQSSTDSVFYLRKISQNGANSGRVANSTAEHIKFSVDDGIVTVTEATAQDGQEPSPGSLDIVIQPTHDGTNDCIAMTLGAQIV